MEFTFDDAIIYISDITPYKTEVNYITIDLEKPALKIQTNFNKYNSGGVAQVNMDFHQIDDSITLSKMSPDHIKRTYIGIPFVRRLLHKHKQKLLEKKASISKIKECDYADSILKRCSNLLINRYEDAVIKRRRKWMEERRREDENDWYNKNGY